jgi:beta-ribofuranosylaminobenzene 5'-phosphate synthase
MTCRLHVYAPCRLHFGMFSFGHADRPQFGGVGMMVSPPAIELTIRQAAQFAVRGSLAERAEHFVNSLLRQWQLSAHPACEITVDSPPDHVGLGIGTQLGLAIAAGLRRYLALPETTAEELAISVGRGARSAVGTYGFRHGGLIVASGKTPGQKLGTLSRAVKIPSEWRVLLVRATQTQGLAGEYETDAFARMPAVPEDVTHHLWQIVNSEMLPSVDVADCDAFGDAVYRFGKLAGRCFASVQGGPFATSEIARLVDSIRAYGVKGAGQSSWGPTVFAITANDAQAGLLQDWLHGSLGIAPGSITMARPNNTGAQVNTFS